MNKSISESQIVVKEPSEKLLGLIRDCRNHKHALHEKLRSLEKYAIQVTL